MTFPIDVDNSIIYLDLGLQQHRLDGEEYIAVIDEFMEAVFTRWPHVIVQVIFSQDLYMFVEIYFNACIFRCCMVKSIVSSPICIMKQDPFRVEEYFVYFPGLFFFLVCGGI